MNAPKPIEHFESHFLSKMAEIAGADDPAHDLLHLKRVVAMAKRLCAQEGGNPEVVVPAAWLHDFVIVPKNDPRRSQASKLSAEAAILFLSEIGYPERHFQAIAHAIEAHSFSAAVEPVTLEARIVQDADRLDGLGAIGVARCFATAGLLKRPFYSEEDPFCEARPPSDREFTTDHFFAKLFKVAETLQTSGGRREGARRAQVMREFLDDLKSEV